MRKLGIILVASLVIASIAISLRIRRQTQSEVAQNEALLQAQRQELAHMLKKQQEISNRLDEASNAFRMNPVVEISKLRQEAESLRSKVAKAEQERRPAAASGVRQLQPGASEEPHPPEYYQQLHALAGAKNADALALGFALRSYAADHQEQVPADLAELAPYLKQEGKSLSGTNQFELVYHGSFDTLTKVPRSAVAVLRDRQTWLAPSGKAARVYGMADGSSQIVESSDDFRSWEAQHVIGGPAH